MLIETARRIIRTFNVSHVASNDEFTYAIAADDAGIICAIASPFDIDDTSGLAYGHLTDLRMEGFVIE